MPGFTSGSSQRVGNLVSFTKHPAGLGGKTTHGDFRVIFFTPSICRIHLAVGDFDDFSYSVVATPEAVEVTYDEHSDKIILSTHRIALHIYRTPLRFVFTDHGGNVINEDDPLGTAWIGEQVTTYKKLQEGERFIGLGEKTGPLDRRGAGYQNWTTDAYAYHAGTDPLYCSTPFYMGIHQQQVYGIFLDNTYKTFFNFGASNNRFSSFSADAGDMNYYFIHGKTVREIIQGYTWLTGRINLPPLWSIAYQQCRYSYYPDVEVLGVARAFREKNIPADAIVMDIHYMDQYKIFTWHPTHFPNPGAMIQELKKMGFEVVLMCDPGIKVEPGYEPHESGVQENVFLTFPDGENYAGQVWPGWCHFPDFTNPRTRAWWGHHFKNYVELGVAGFWNDMNEIATWGNMLPENLAFDFEGNHGTSRRGRNIYGFQMSRSTYEGTSALMKKRPFNLTRSGFSGVQRYAAVWTGDNVAYDDHMMLGVRLVNSMGLTGIAFAGYDVGGFVGEASSKLFARWISIGAFSPFFRGHSMINTRDSEPWSYGEEVEQISRNYIRIRYQLLPYIYSLFHESSETGMPIQRSLALDYPFLHQVFDHRFHHQYLFGPFLLIAPVESTKDVTKVFFPDGDWHYLHDGQRFSGQAEFYIECPIHKLPVFIKEGAILPMQRAVHSTKELVDELEIHLYSGSQPTSFEFYEDDGSSFRYREGVYAKRIFTFQPGEKKFSITQTEGSFETGYKKIKLMFHRFDAPPAHITINGNGYGGTRDRYSLFLPYEKYDPIHDPERINVDEVMYFTFDNAPGHIEIQW